MRHNAHDKMFTQSLRLEVACTPWWSLKMWGIKATKTHFWHTKPFKSQSTNSHTKRTFKLKFGPRVVPKFLWRIQLVVDSAKHQFQNQHISNWKIRELTVSLGEPEKKKEKICWNIAAAYRALHIERYLSNKFQHYHYNNSEKTHIQNQLILNWNFWELALKMGRTKKKKN